MRVLVVGHQFSTTGASTMLLHLMRLLAADGHAVVHRALDPTPGPMLRACAAAGFPVAPAAPAPSEVALAIVNTVVGGGAVLALAPRVPTIWWLHEAEVGLRVLREAAESAGAFSDAAAVVVQTAFQRDEIYRPFTAALPPGRVRILPNPVPALDGRLAVPRPRAGRLRIVAVGTVEPRKRHADLIAAVYRLARPDIELVICGRLVHLPAEAAAMAEAAEGRVHLVGDVPRGTCLGWLASADMVCLPSESESQPLAALEAAELGRALVLSDLPCYRGVYRDGRDALLHPVGDVEALAGAIARLADDPPLRAALGAAARETASGFSEATFRDRFLALAREVARPG